MAKSPGAVQSPLNVGVGGQVHLPTNIQYLSISIPEWRRCMSRIEQIGSDPGVLENIAFALIGLGGGSLLSAAGLYASVEYSKFVQNVEVVNWRGVVITALMLTIGLGALGIGLASLYHSRDKRAMMRDATKNVLSDMHGLEANCPSAVAPLLLPPVDPIPSPPV